jgi:hypothetical protein
MPATNPDVFAEIGTLTDLEGMTAKVFRDYDTLVMPYGTLTLEELPNLRKIIDVAEVAMKDCRQRMADDEAASLDHEAWRDGEDGQ